MTAVAGTEPVIMLTAPGPAATLAVKKAGMTFDDIDLFEVNEAFAAVVLKFFKDTGVGPAKVNVNGGAMALGHPIGATRRHARRHAPRRTRTARPPDGSRRDVHRRRYGYRHDYRARISLAPAAVVTIDDVRALALKLPRSYEALVRDRVKFRVGRIVYLAFSRDETLMGFGFPKEEREALVASDPAKFLMPEQSDMRYNWAVVRLDELDLDEMRELVLDAWRMGVPNASRAGLADGRRTWRTVFGLALLLPVGDDQTHSGDVEGAFEWGVVVDAFRHAVVDGRKVFGDCWVGERERVVLELRLASASNVVSTAGCSNVRAGSPSSACAPSDGST